MKTRFLHKQNVKSIQIIETKQKLLVQKRKASSIYINQIIIVVPYKNVNVHVSTIRYLFLENTNQSRILLKILK